MGYIKLNGQEIELNNFQEFVSKAYLSHIEIQLQSAPIQEVGVNGCQIDDVLLLCTEILKSFNKNVSCRQTSIAITKLEEAAMWLTKRTLERTERGVEGTNKE